jgi:hypothetical protein
MEQIKSVLEEACQPKWQSCEKIQFKDEEPGGVILGLEVFLEGGSRALASAVIPLPPILVIIGCLSVQTSFPHARTDLLGPGKVF